MLKQMTPGERLREARQRIGFTSAAQAAKAMDVPIATYTGHEANHRGFPAKRAALYAKHLQVSVNWLLFGEETAAERQTQRVPIIATIDSGESTIREINGAVANMTVPAPADQPAAQFAFTLAHDAMHVFAGWTLFAEAKTPKLSQIAEDKLCLCWLSNGHLVLAKPRRAATDGLFHYFFFGDQPATDVKINAFSRIVASRM